MNIFFRDEKKKTLGSHVSVTCPQAAPAHRRRSAGKVNRAGRGRTLLLLGVWSVLHVTVGDVPERQSGGLGSSPGTLRLSVRRGPNDSRDHAVVTTVLAQVPPRDTQRGTGGAALVLATRTSSERLTDPPSPPGSSARSGRTHCGARGNTTQSQTAITTEALIPGYMANAMETDSIILVIMKQLFYKISMITE